MPYSQKVRSYIKYKIYHQRFTYLLTFNKHIANLCKKTASQLNVLKRLSIWHFCSESNTAKVEKIQERALRLVHDDHISDYPTLLGTSAIDPLKTKRIKTLATEIYKAINSINSNYKKEIFKMNESQKL